VTVKNKELKDKIVGFFPSFYSIGETVPILKIAKLYQKNGGNIVLFSHGGNYEYLSEELDCPLIKLQDFWDAIIKSFKDIFEKGAPVESSFYETYEESHLQEIVKEEIKVFKESKINLMVSSFNLSAAISVRAINVPLITLISGTITPLYYEAGNATFPDNYENNFTRIIPSIIKNKIAKWYLLHNKILVKDFNKIGKKYNIIKFKRFEDILFGDYTLVCDDIQMLDVKPNNKIPLENFIGPIYGPLIEKKEKEIDKDIITFLKKPGKKILINMGQGCEPDLFLKILSAVSKTKYNVIAVRAGFNEEQAPKNLNENILFKTFIPQILKVNQQVDLSIIHGGRGTTYTAVNAAKPIIGIPIFIEQQYNIENIVRKKAGLRISKKFFTEEKLIKAVNKIFDDYDFYLKNIQNLQRLISKEPGENKAAERIIEIINSNK
jgi:UDP:flavonoid glycosyltransferase YjiC (YdhE family)